MRDAVLAGVTLNIFNNHCDRVRMANLAQIVNVLQSVILTNKQKIILTLSRMHRSKESLAHARIRREIPALLSAAEAYFGSWGKALHAAGIDPNLYFVHHKWRKRKTSDKRNPAKL
jgi:hypothetical protein